MVPRPALGGPNLFPVGRRLQRPGLAVRGVDGVLGLGGAELVQLLGRPVDEVAALALREALGNAAEHSLLEEVLLVGGCRVEGSSGGSAGCGLVCRGTR